MISFGVCNASDVAPTNQKCLAVVIVTENQRENRLDKNSRVFPFGIGGSGDFVSVFMRHVLSTVASFAHEVALQL